MNRQPECFWMVWNPESRNPAVRHSTRQSARRESERLARNHPGATFVVLRSVSECCVNDVVHIEHDDNEVPF